MPSPTHLPLASFRVQLRDRLDVFSAGPHEPDADAAPGARASRRYLWLDGLLSNASESFVLSFLPQFALAFGATNAQIGILGGAANAAAAAGAVKGAHLGELPGQRKRVVLLSGGLVARLLLLTLAALPVVLAPSAIIYGVILLAAVRAFAQQVGFPAWSALLADLVPPGVRGRYFSARNVGMSIAALVSAPLAGQIVQWGGVPGGFQMAFAMAAGLGLAATVAFAHVNEPLPARAVTAASRPRTSAWAVLRGRPNFRAFIIVAFLWNLSLTVAGPFFVVHQVRNLKASPFQIGLIAAIYAIGNVAGQRFWGRMNDRRGAFHVMRITGLLIPFIPALWAVIPRWYYLLAVETMSGFLWAGYLLAVFNMMLAMAPDDQRSHFAAIYQMAISAASFLGPLIGSVVASILPIPALFALSAGGRLLASSVMIGRPWGETERPAAASAAD